MNATMEETGIVKTFTMSKLAFGPDELQEFTNSTPAETAIVNALAYVTGYEVVPNKKEPTKHSLRFFGSFEFTSRLTGELVRSAQAFVPGPAEGYLRGLKDGNEAGGVRVAFMITVKKVPLKVSNTGYVFGMKAFLSKDKAQDPFAELREVFPEPKKAIAAASKK